ncbi:MAG TPA: amino acid transporter [Aeromicrobium sp.]|nr:amino acid transporter [Aeromicrobium sp.]
MTHAQGPLSEEIHPEHRHHWSKVMCLTGVDYFSTLGYQPGIAALAAGSLAPLATVVLVLLTLFGAVPVYRRVAAESPHGQGSISMLQQLLPFWRGKLFVLVLLGFAATSWVITITLSAADATAHIVENPLVPHWFEGKEVWITVLLILGLGAVFLRGFTEAIGVAVFITVVYMGLNAVVIAVSFLHVLQEPQVVSDWSSGLTAQHGNPIMMVALALILFPKLALGMSGFETGVAVMTHVKGDASDTDEAPAGRIRNTKKLLVAAAVIMSGYLIASSVVTTWLIPAEEFKEGGEANGRALAYLAHVYLGEAFGTVYDASTVTILWFAGASAMAGLLNLVPRYLPRFGMAPEWASAIRPLVVVITAISCLVTWLFAASVDAQGGAYATGVLVLFSSASVAVTLAARKARQHRMTVAFAVISLVMLYTTGVNVVERPDGVQIGTAFIIAILAVSLVSRIRRAFELRSPVVELDEKAEQWVEDLSRRGIRIIAHQPDDRGPDVYRKKIDQIVADNDLPNPYDLMFLEVTLTDPSDFESHLEVRGVTQHKKYRVLEVESPSVPNAIAAILLHIRDVSGVRPHVYFEWTEGNPLSNLAKFLLFGMGEVAPVTREVLRRAERERKERPRIHVG